MKRKDRTLGEVIISPDVKIDVPEVNVTYDRSAHRHFDNKITSSNNIADFIRNTFNEGEIELQEYFLVVLLNRGNKVIGYYRHSKGGIAGTVVDIRIILAVALKSLACSLILAHNHPSGNTSPSEQDRIITKKIVTAAKAMEISIFDHLIITRDSYYSFADQGLLGPPEPLLAENLSEFVGFVEKDLRVGYKHNKRSIEALAYSLKIKDRTEIKELTELAIVNVAREIASTNETTEQKYERIVQLYNDQVTLSHRTSQSILLQQYSTPAPIAYLMGVFCGLPEMTTGWAFEPSAGNGLLTIAGKPQNFVVNEVDYTRNRNLRTQGFLEVKNSDASKPFEIVGKKFNAVLTNPPFGVIDEPVNYNSFPIRVLDHLMSLRALDLMADNGRAAIIIGGHSKWDEMGRFQKGKNRIYFNYLYRHYHVMDVIQIEGKKLYTKQGTGFPVRLILIAGRKLNAEGAAPLKNENSAIVIYSFEALYERVMQAISKAGQIQTEIKVPMMDIEEIKRKARDLQRLIGGNNLSGSNSDTTETPKVRLWRRWKEMREAYRDDDVLLMEDDTMFLTYDKDAQLLQRKINSGGVKMSGSNYQFLVVGMSKVLWLTEYFPKIVKAGLSISIIPNGKPTNWKELEDDYINFITTARGDFPDLGSPYTPASNACVVLNTQVPDSMSFETQSAVQRIKEEVGGDMDNFVRHRLGYATRNALCQALSAEQIDAVAMAIYNIEAKAQGMIIGDQTGIGKGRIAASMIRYAVKKGVKPIFITEKANLFSDIYRDLVAIGSGHLRPFIINSKEAKTEIKDEDGEVIYEALSPVEQDAIFETGEIPAHFDFVVATYSQFNSPAKKPTKPNYLRQIAENNIMIMDEAHNSSGSSNTGTYMQSIVGGTQGVVFLSATFAKKPDNMPIYAMKTAINEANLSKDALVRAIKSGGVALQEILSSQLVAEGQMIRRERSFEGIEVNYVQLDNYEEAHRRTSDKITNILRYIIAFQEGYVDKKVDEMDKVAADAGEQVAKRGGTSQAGVDNLPYFSKVFNVINQMLFSIKAEAVADRAIARLKEGKKPVIAFASTMGSFIEQMENEEGFPVTDGDSIRLDFAEVLKRGLDGILRYTVYGADGNKSFGTFSPAELGPDAHADYLRIREEIDTVSTGIAISPIDVIIQKLEKAGYSVAEVTGRKFSVDIQGERGVVTSRKKLITNDAFRKFNNNEVDVLMINQSGSTGSSAHAIVTSKVPKEQVKQRVMIILQAELDINIEVQKRGRINRTAQIMLPIYDYVNSAIPAEKRLMMMAQKKLKSLDANTTSNQKQSTKILDVPDFLNKYGDKVVKEYLAENPEIDKLLGRPLSDGTVKDAGEDDAHVEDAAHKVSGRVAVLSTKMQAEFYNEMTERYNDYVEYLKQIGEYDLEVEALDLKAETIESNITIMGKGGETAFGEDSVLEKVNANILKKPFKANEVESMINEALAGRKAEDIKAELIEELTNDFQKRIGSEVVLINSYYDNMIREIPDERKIKKLVEDQQAYSAAIEQRKKEIEELRNKELEMLKGGKSKREEDIRRIISFFTIGRQLAYPVSADESSENILAICLGVVIDRKKKNPYARSAVKVRLAIANSMKYVAIPASRENVIDKIISRSHDIDQQEIGELLTDWEMEIRSRSKDRGTRFIITGNLLQAFGEDGKLVSYTTTENQTKKGILMSEDWVPGDLGKQRVTVPIIKAIKLLKSLTNGNSLIASDGVSFLKMSNDYRIIVPSSKSKGGAYYMDQEIWPLIENNKFEIASDKMQAILPAENIEALAEILQRKHSISVELGLNQLALVDKTKSTFSSKKKIILPPKEDDKELERLRIIKIKAKALAIKLKLKMAA